MSKIEKAFEYHQPSIDGLKSIQLIRESFSDTLRVIELLCPVSRERSLALTDLEASCMWATKSLVLPR